MTVKTRLILPIQIYHGHRSSGAPNGSLKVVEIHLKIEPATHKSTCERIFILNNPKKLGIDFPLLMHPHGEHFYHWPRLDVKCSDNHSLGYETGEFVEI